MIVQNATFAERFNEALEIREIKPVDLSNKTGISQSTISQYRSGYAEPKKTKLKILADALNVNPSWLLGLDVPMNDKLERAVIDLHEFGSDTIIEQIVNNKGAYEIACSYLLLDENNQKLLLNLAKSLLPDDLKQK